MSKTKPTLYVIDGSGYIFRAYYGIRPLSTRDGLPTNAVIGFARMLAKLLKTEKPTHLAIAFDGPEKTFRHGIYDQYKANRESPPEDLIPQFGLIQELVDAMGIPRLVAHGFEADDILATIATQGQKAGFETIVVSADKDLMQLVGDGVQMFDPMKERHYNRDEVIERFGVPPELVADALALAGDSSDNIPGVPKVGPKSAAKLIEAFGDVEAVIKALGEKVAAGEKTKAFERSVVENADKARLSKELTILRHDVPLNHTPKELTYDGPNKEALTPFLQKVEAFALLRDFGLSDTAAAAQTLAPPVAAKTAASAAAEDTTPTTLPDTSTARVIYDVRELDALLAAAKEHKRMSLHCVEGSDGDLLGIAVAAGALPPSYVPLSHQDNGDQADKKEVLERLREAFSDPAIQKHGYHLKWQMRLCARHGVSFQGLGEDPRIAAYVTDPSRSSFSFHNLCRDVLAHDALRMEDVLGKGRSKRSVEEVPVHEFVALATERLFLMPYLLERLHKDLKAQEMFSLYRELEMPLVPVLGAMEIAGIKVDHKRLAAIGEEFLGRLEDLEKKAHGLAGEPFNLGSTKQLGHILFEKQGAPVVKKTKTGFSTDHEVLETLAPDYELAEVVLEHRMLAKLQSTYVQALQDLANPKTHRVHTTFNQTGAATGRLSSTDPNLQNIPIRTPDGQRIRSCFVADKGNVLLSADYSQIELRVMAHLSEDPAFIQAFVDGQDIHARTAMEILTDGKTPDAEARRQAKAINFGILYGLSEFGLSKQLGIPRQMAHDYIARYFSRYPGIRAFLDGSIASAQDHGYVTTLLGRRRQIANIKSKNRNIRMGAERIAMNTPIQGSAADLIKLAMLRVQARLEKEKRQSKMLLQVHDELVLECPKDEAEAVATILREEMAAVQKLKVPLVVDVGQGKSWREAH